MKVGSISCKIVKNVAAVCLNSVPNELRMGYCGPVLYKSSFYLYFEGSTIRGWPVHDPCGTATKNHLTNIAIPSGALYVR